MRAWLRIQGWNVIHSQALAICIVIFMPYEESQKVYSLARSIIPWIE